MSLTGTPADSDGVVTPHVEAAEHDATPTEQIRHLRELIDALDRRVPHIGRSGETAIARDAADLRARALKRLAALQA